MKKFLALSFALALTFSTTVCAAETVVPTKDFTRMDTLSTNVEKARVYIQRSFRDGRRS